MGKDFIIDQISWHTRVAGNPETKEEVFHRFRAVVEFLEREGLVKRHLQPEIEKQGEEFSIRSSDLEQEGLALMKRAYDRWLKSQNRSRDPTKLSILEKELSKIRAEKSGNRT